MIKRRYVSISRPKAEDDYWGNDEMERNLTVYERETRPQETGLVDRYGVPLYAVEDRQPIGFVSFGRERAER